MLLWAKPTSQLLMPFKNFIINLSNLGWIGNYAAHSQHFCATQRPWSHLNITYETKLRQSRFLFNRLAFIVYGHLQIFFRKLFLNIHFFTFYRFLLSKLLFWKHGNQKLLLKDRLAPFLTLLTKKGLENSFKKWYLIFLKHYFSFFFLHDR